LFQNLGKGVVYNYDKYNDYEVIDSTIYKKGKIFSPYGNFEPRLGFKYELNNLTSIKGSYTRTAQYMQMATNSTAGTPMDMWFTASPNVKPQLSDMASIGMFRNLFNDKLETSLEVYYKEMQNTIDFKDHAVLYGNQRLDGELRFGQAKSYGAELMIQFPSTRLNGWVSYTYSHTERTIKEINEGRTYLAPYDKPHSVNVVLNYELTKRIIVGATWVYATGAPLTIPAYRMEVGNVMVPGYTERNTFRMPDYHRLDLSLTFKGKVKPGRWWQGEWNISAYNAYMRKNAWIIRFVRDEKDPNRTYAEKFYLFSIIPSVTYNFKF
jgi:outer membrane receptor protein involved in Fe transport